MQDCGFFTNGLTFQNPGHGRGLSRMATVGSGGVQETLLLDKQNPRSTVSNSESLMLKSKIVTPLWALVLSLLWPQPARSVESIEDVKIDIPYRHFQGFFKSRWVETQAVALEKFLDHWSNPRSRVSKNQQGF